MVFHIATVALAKSGSHHCSSQREYIMEDSMSKYRIGITEAGDAGLDLTWANKLNTVDRAVVITKCPTSDFVDAVLEHRDKIMIHITCTGYGGSVLEPNVPKWPQVFDTASNFVRWGFPQEKMVVRVDPIIPTDKGLDKALRVIEAFMEMHFNRFRVSVIDMYQHVRDRFLAAGLPLPYGERFGPSRAQLGEVDAMLREAGAYWQNNVSPDYGPLRIESCAEPGLREAIPCGCISSHDFELFGLDLEDTDCGGRQRPRCMCYSGKVELLRHKMPCSHGCLYCYWKSK